MTTFELLGLYYDLKDGLFWNAYSKLVGFRSRLSARTFKRMAPDWTVQYLAGN